MVDVQQFAGAMDLDSSLETVGKGFVREARNIEWIGPFGNRKPQAALGTNLVASSYLPNTGVNLTINATYDQRFKRIFFFNFNSLGSHGIYIYNTLTATFQRLIQNGVNTQGDVLGFTTGRISNVDILYQDDNKGSLLFWLDSLKRPRKLNIDRLLNGGYTTIKTVFLDVIKAPPASPIYCVYENGDSTVTSNNLINTLFNFTCSHLYDDFEESVLAGAAAQPLPPDPFDPSNNIPQARCSRIGIYLPTGDQNVTKIKVYAKQTNGGATSDWYVVTTLVKADLGIPDNSIYKFLFYNNTTPIAADVNLTSLDADVVPINAESQALLNGNVVAYAAITEGYDFINSSFGITTSNAVPPSFYLNGTLFFASPNGLFTSGQPQITIYLSGVGVNDGFGNPTTLEKAPANLFVRAKSGSSDISFSYANSGSNQSISFLLSHLSTAATGAGWVVDSTGTNSITVHYPTGNVVLQSAYSSGLAVSTSAYSSSVSASYPQADYSYGVVYRDYAGRTNGVISNITGNVKTQIGVDGQVPVIQLGLAGWTPPIWAIYYDVVRTDNLTYQKYLGWVSQGAYQGTGSANGTLYGYFDVSNISNYNTSILATEGVISYGFSQGDRIRILGRYDAAGNFTPLNLDYAILGLQTGPVINGQIKAGSFIQIYYPTSDINSNFQLTTIANDTNFQNYKILIYSYKSQSPTTTTGTSANVFFQMGQRYGIGNPGTVSAYHIGNTADGQVTLSDGDGFFRQRNVPIVNSYSVPTGSYTQGSPYGTVWVNPGAEGTPIVNNGIWEIRGDTNKVAGLLNTQYPTYADANMTFENLSTFSFNVRVRWQVNITDVVDANGQWAMYIKLVPPSNVPVIIQTLNLQTALAPGVVNTYQIDTTFNVPAGAKFWLVNFAQNEMLVQGGQLLIDVIRNRQINVFDASFSDIYSLKTNSDNKPNVINVEALQTTSATLFRYSEPAVLGTDINTSNRFYPTNFDEFDIRFGQVVRMVQWERRLRILQERKCGEIGVYSKFIKNNTGQTELIVNDQIIQQNNIQYMDGDYGIGNQPDAVAVNGFQLYFVDPVRGDLLRWSLDGIKSISHEFFAQTFAGTIAPNYLSQYNYPYGGNAAILLAYKYSPDKDNEVYFGFQDGTAAPTTIGPASLAGQILKFNEVKNSFTNFLDFAPDSLVCAENTLYSFRNGQMYIHNNTTNYATYYGAAKPISVTLISNEKEAIKKTFMTLAYQAYLNKVWQAVTVGDITTSEINNQTGLPQISQLINPDFEVNEGNIYAAFLRDANSMADSRTALLEGDYLKGNWIQIKLTAPDNNFNWLYAPLIKWEASMKTP